MKYEFKELTLDTYELHYTNVDGEKKILPFKRTIELAQKLQSADANARFKMLKFLKEQGESKETLTIETHTKDGKIIRDESNYREFEASFIEREGTLLLIEVFNTLFHKTPDEILFDLGAEKYPNDAEKFILEFRDILINGKVKTPSIQKISE